MAPAWKPEPVTVTVQVPTLNGFGVTAVITGAAGVVVPPPEPPDPVPPPELLAVVTGTVRVLPQVVPGFFTQNLVLVAVAGSQMETVTEVELTWVPVSWTPSSRTVAPARKPLPRSLMVEVPVGTGLGVAEVRVGAPGLMAVDETGTVMLLLHAYPGFLTQKVVLVAVDGSHVCAVSLPPEALVDS